MSTGKEDERVVTASGLLAVGFSSGDEPTADHRTIGRGWWRAEPKGGLGS
jgi:hypothetical protein